MSNNVFVLLLISGACNVITFYRAFEPRPSWLVLQRSVEDDSKRNSNIITYIRLSKLKYSILIRLGSHLYCCLRYLTWLSSKLYMVCHFDIFWKASIGLFNHCVASGRVLKEVRTEDLNNKTVWQKPELAFTIHKSGHLKFNRTVID